MPITNDVLDQILKDYEKPEDLLSENGLLQQLNKALVERALNGEMTHHPGYEKRQQNWARVIPMFSFAPEIRKAIYTTNTIESLNMTLRKIIKNRAMFPSDEAVFKILYLALKNISKKWTMPIHDWSGAMNQFAILFENRLPSSSFTNSSFIQSF